MYELCCAPIIDRSAPPGRQPHNPYHVQFDPNTPLYLHNLSHVCNQIRREYFSFLLGKHQVTVKSLRAAQHWNAATSSGLRSFLPVFDMILGTWITLPTTIELTGGSIPKSWRVTLHAVYRIGGPSKNVALRFGFYCKGEHWTLDRNSKKAVQRCLNRRLLSQYYFDFDNFVHMTEEIADMKLFGRFVRPRRMSGMKTVVHEPSFWVDQTVYPRQVSQSQCYEYVECEDLDE